MIDERDWAAEPNWQACRLRRNYGAISFSDPPVDATIGITVAVLHRDKIEFDTVDITADRIEERIKAAIGFEQLGRAAVSIVGADCFETLVEAPGRLGSFLVGRLCCRPMGTRPQDPWRPAISLPCPSLRSSLPTALRRRCCGWRLDCARSPPSGRNSRSAPGHIVRPPA